MFDEHVYYENAGDFLELRKKYRAEALRQLRIREKLPVPTVDSIGRCVYVGQDEQAHSWATGSVKQPYVQVEREGKSPAAAPTEEIYHAWQGQHEFKILDVSFDGKPIENELRDLSRDAEQMGKVKADFGVASSPAPDLIINNIADEAEIDNAIQGYIKRHNG